jgi:hypothetical protein
MEADLVGTARTISLPMGIVKILWISRFKSLVDLNSRYQKMISIMQAHHVDLSNGYQKMISIMQAHHVDHNSRYHVRRLVVNLSVGIIII